MDFKDLELNFKKFDEILQKKGWTVEKLETKEERAMRIAQSDVSYIYNRTPRVTEKMEQEYHKLKNEGARMVIMDSVANRARLPTADEYRVFAGSED